MATTHAAPSNTAPRPPPSKLAKNGKPVATVKFGSASVPVYRCGSGGRVRFAISHYRDGKRLRQFFTTLEGAKKEALLVAQRIQAGMQHVADLKPHERDNYSRAVELLGSLNIPLVAAVEDYVQTRKLAESESLTAMATASRKWPRNVLRHSYISYRIAKIKSADQVALEAGNSPSIIFKHYRELGVLGTIIQAWLLALDP